MKTKNALLFFNSSAFNLMNASDIVHGITLLNNPYITGLNNPQRAALDPTSRYFAVAMNGSPYLKVFDFNTNEYVTLGSSLGMGLDCHFSPDGAWLAVGHQYYSNRYLTIYNTSTWQRDATAPSFTNNCTSVAFDPTGSYLAVSCDNSPYLTILNVGTWSTVSSTPSVSSSQSLAWSSTGNKLAHAITSYPYLNIYNTSNWSTISGTPEPVSTPSNLIFSPTGNYFSYTDDYSALKIHLVSDWSEVKRVNSGISKVQTSFTSDDAYFGVAITGSTDTLRVYKTSDWSTTSGNTALNFALLGVFFSQSPLLSEITGVISDIDENLYSTPVRLYSRSSGALLDKTTSNVSGEFSLVTYINGEINTIAVCPAAKEAEFNDHVLRGSV